MGCKECSFKCCSMNQLCRHMHTTRHCIVQCPVCNEYIVPFYFHTIMSKLTRRPRSSVQMVRPTSEASGTAGVGQPVLESSHPLFPVGDEEMQQSYGNDVPPITYMDSYSHAKCPGSTTLRPFERNDFVVRGRPEDFGLTPVVKTDALSLRSTVPSEHIVATGDASSPFRCMECLARIATWTQLTRHIETTGHTLPLCIVCFQALKCFGMARPQQHEIRFGHSGFYGVYYMRKDYTKELQHQWSSYTSENNFTGLSMPQYRCVCGVTFLHPVSLAYHLRTVHHATCVSNDATCHQCGFSGTLEAMVEHMRVPCGNPPVTATAPPPFIEQVLPSTTSNGPPPRIIEVHGFSGTQFLQYRPLLPPYTTSDPSLIGESYFGSNGAEQEEVERERRSAPSVYTVLYQCRECFFIFTSWEKMVHHIQVTGHCRTYCVTCRTFLPTLLQFSSTSTRSGARDEGVAAQIAAQTSADPMIRSTSLTEHLRHLSKHGNIIGYPTSPETLEVLVDLSTTAYTKFIDPVPEALEGGGVAVYQCPGEKANCFEVFLSYGSFIEHVMKTGHASLSSSSSCPCSGSCGLEEDAKLIPSALPMITYRVKFKDSQLCDHFNFQRCEFCRGVFPPAELPLHQALCIPRLEYKFSASK